MDCREIEEAASVDTQKIHRSRLKFTVTKQRVKMLGGNIDNSTENAEGVCQY